MPQRFWLRIYGPHDGNFAVEHDQCRDHLAHLTAEVRDRQSDMPLCYVFSNTTGQRIVNALNAQQHNIAVDAFR